jgi:hypothetical protein
MLTIICIGCIGVLRALVIVGEWTDQARGPHPGYKPEHVAPEVYRFFYAYFSCVLD